jgi:deoxyribonuclease-4
LLRLANGIPNDGKRDVASNVSTADTFSMHIGKGTIGKETFRMLLNDLRLAHAAFIAETPIDEPGDDRRNVDALKKLEAIS